MKAGLNDWVDFVEKVGDEGWILAGTVTLHKSHPQSKKRLHVSDAKDTARYLLCSTNRRLFNHRAERHQATLAAAVMMGHDAYGELSHLHFVFGTPLDLSYDKIASAVERSILRASWCNEEYKLNPYKDTGWLRYMLSHGTVYLLDEYLLKAKS